MDLPEETSKPEEPTPSKETFPEELILPEGFTPLGDSTHLPRARRRRAHRRLVPLAADKRAAMLDDLARRAFPSFEFFMFAFLCGVILGAAYLLNAPAMLLLGILLAPLLTPWVGLTLAAVTGSWRFFFLTLGGLLVAGALVFLTGALAGLAGRLWVNLPFYYARTHAQLWWPDLLVVALGAALLAISFVRSEQKPILASVMLAYGLFLPVSAAGIGLGIGKDIGGVTLWPNGLLVFLVHLALATLVGGIVLVAMRFKPMRVSGYLLPIFLGLLTLVALVVLTGLVTFIRDGITAARHMAPTPTPTTLILPSTTPIVVQTSTPLPISMPSATLSPAFTLQPTPVYDVIAADPAYGGAVFRAEPGRKGIQLAILNNGTIVQVLPEIENVGTETWVRVRVDTLEGWVLQAVLAPTTLIPTPVPTSTFTPTP
ncbi:MAG TPA: SH3 domain-containing protein [Anaerolineales bacterium]